MNRDQIAAEAADTISDWIDQYVASSDSDKTLPKDRKAIAVIIKSAIEKATKEINDMWTRASRQADTLAEYLVDAKAEIAVLQSRAAHTSGGNRFTCPKCGLEPAHASERGILTHDGKRDAMSPLYEAAHASEPTDQLAAEAARWLFGQLPPVKGGYPFTIIEVENRIKSAIEKAYQDGFVHGRSKRPWKDREDASDPKNFTESGNPLPVLRCPYCDCKSLHEDALTMCCQRAISETLLRAAHTSEPYKHEYAEHLPRTDAAAHADGYGQDK